MLVQEKNKVNHLSLISGSHINAKYVENVNDYYIKNRTIVINPNTSLAYVGEPPRNIIPALSSTILKDTSVAEADSLLLLEVTDVTNIGNIILEPDWVLLGDTMGDDPAPSNELPYPKNTPLWRSAQVEAGFIELDPYVMTGQASETKEKQNFRVQVNLWFAPSHTNCFIHNTHDFIEIHTQIFGVGRMQKFKAQDYDTLYEDLIMSEGYTTYIPFCQVEENNQYTYPWHQYYADTDCIWMAIEYHPAD